MARNSKSNRNTRNSRGKSEKIDYGNKYTNQFRDAQTERGNKNMHTSNDPKWHAASPQLIEDLGRHSFFRPAGTSIRFAGFGLGGNSLSVPNICALHYIPSVGQAQKGSQGINLAASQQYDIVRKANSGSATYDAPDLMINYLAKANVYMYYAFLCRVWGLLRTFDALNKYTPRGYFEAMNLDYDSFANNPAQFKTQLDLVAAQINEVCILPKSFNYSSYLQYMSSNVFKEADSNQANRYIWVPDCVFKYEGYASSKGGQLTPIWLQSTHGHAVAKFTADGCIKVIKSMIDAISEDGDSPNFNGDIIKAYGSNLVFAPVIAYDFFVLPIYDETMLRSIHNATFIGEPDIASISIAQDPEGQGTFGGTLVAAFKFKASGVGSDCNRIIDSNTSNPDPKDFVEWLRFANIATGSTGISATSDGKFHYVTTTYTHLGVAAATTMTIYKLNGGNGKFEAITSSSFLESTSIFGNEIQVFDWHPILYMSDKTLNDIDTLGPDATIARIIGDLDVFTLVDNATLETYHNIEVFSMFVANL